MAEPEDDDLDDEDDDDDEPEAPPERGGRKPMAKEVKLSMKPENALERDGFLTTFLAGIVGNIATDAAFKATLGDGPFAGLISKVEGWVGAKRFQDLILPAISAVATDADAKRVVQALLSSLHIPPMLSPFVGEAIEDAIEGIRVASKSKENGEGVVTPEMADRISADVLRKAKLKIENRTAEFKFADLFLLLSAEDQATYLAWVTYLESSKPEDFKLWTDFYRSQVTTLPMLEYVIKTARGSTAGTTEFDAVLPVLRHLIPGAVKPKKEEKAPSPVASAVEKVVEKVKKSAPDPKKVMEDVKTRLQTAQAKADEDLLQSHNRRLTAKGIPVEFTDLVAFNANKATHGFKTVLDYVRQKRT